MPDWLYDRLFANAPHKPLPSGAVAPDVALLDMNLVGTVIAVRPYCHTDHYWQVYFDTNEAIVRTARECGWPAPMPATLMKTMPA